MNKEQVSVLKAKIHEQLIEQMDLYMKETGQDEALTTEFGQGLAFAFGAAHGIVSKVFHEESEKL